MAKQYKVTLEAELVVSFPEETKTRAYFLDGDWRESFWTFLDLDELAEHVAFDFQQEGPYWDDDKKTFVVRLEGFPDFLKQKDGTYLSDPEHDFECGAIRVETKTEIGVSGRAVEMGEVDR